jgi:hypothetical protein
MNEATFAGGGGSAWAESADGWVIGNEVALETLQK